MSLTVSIVVFLFIGVASFIILSADKNTNFTFGDLSIFSFAAMLFSLVLIIPLHLLYLDREETRVVCERLGGVLIKDFKTCVKKDVHEAYLNKENHIKMN